MFRHAFQLYISLFIIPIYLFAQSNTPQIFINSKLKYHLKSNRTVSYFIEDIKVKINPSHYEFIKEKINGIEDDDKYVLLNANHKEFSFIIGEQTVKIEFTDYKDGKLTTKINNKIIIASASQDIEKLWYEINSAINQSQVKSSLFFETAYAFVQIPIVIAISALALGAISWTLATYDCKSIDSALTDCQKRKFKDSIRVCNAAIVNSFVCDNFEKLKLCVNKHSANSCGILNKTNNPVAR